MEDPLVSAIIVTYNRAYCIDEAIQSILDQTYQNIEIIVVDDGSTDNTIQVINEIDAGDREFFLVQQTNQGVTEARNRGLTVARGRYIAFLDSDDVWEPWKIATQVEILEANPSVVVTWTDISSMSVDGTILEKKFIRTMYSAYQDIRIEQTLKERWTTSKGDEVLIGDLYPSMIFGNLIHTSSMMFPRLVLTVVGQYDTQYTMGEDYDFHFRLCKQGNVAFLDKPGIRYRISDDQLTSSKSSLNLLRAAENNLSVVLRNANDPKMTIPSRCLNPRISSSYCWVANQCLNNRLYFRTLWNFIRVLTSNPTLETVRQGIERITRRLRRSR